MMRLIAVLCLLLGGCAWRINADAVAMATASCLPNGGLKSIEAMDAASMGRGFEATCNNGLIIRGYAK